MAADRRTALPREAELITPATGDAERLKRIRTLTKVLDNAFRVPGTNWRFGWDSLIGLVPGGGDVVTGLLATYIVIEATKLGLPKKIVRLMIANVVIDLAGGAVPFAGDLFDFVFKANRKNLKLLEEHLAQTGRTHELNLAGRAGPSAPADQPNRAGRLTRAVLIGAMLPLSWLAMQIVHEAGHVLAAWSTGGTVTAVVLHPLAISRTDVSPNPHPLVVAWSGPLFGALAPVALWLAVRALRWRSTYLWRFFAGFCLVANGLYIGLGALWPVGDAADLVRMGTPWWLLATFGLLAAPAGLALWHGLGTSFGPGGLSTAPMGRHAASVAGLLAIIVAGGVAWTRWTGFR